MDVTKIEVIPFTAAGAEPGATPPSYVLAVDGVPLTTPAGRPVSHASKALLEAIRKEARRRRSVKLDRLSLYAMLNGLIDGSAAMDVATHTYREAMLHDLTFQRCAGPEVVDQMAHLDALLRYLDEQHLPELVMSQSRYGQDQADYLDQTGCGADLETWVRFVDQQMAAMDPAARCVVHHTVGIHQVFVLGLMLAQEACTVREYVDGTMAVHGLVPGIIPLSARERAKAVKGFEADASLMLEFMHLARQAA